MRRVIGGAALLLTIACPGKGEYAGGDSGTEPTTIDLTDTDTDTDSDTDTDTDTDADSDADADTDTDTDSDTDTDTDSDTDTDTTADLVPRVAFVGLGRCRGAPVDPAVSLIPGDNSIDGFTSGWESHGCPALGAEISIEDDAITLTLIDGAATPCEDRTCWWETAFSLADVPAGTWTVTVDDVTESVEVE